MSAVAARRMGVVLVLVVASGGVAAAASAQTQLTRATAPASLSRGSSDAIARVLLDVRITDEIHTGIMGRVTPAGIAYLPLQSVLLFAGLRHSVSGDAISAAASSDRSAFKVDAGTMTARFDQTSIALSDADMLLEGHDIFVSTALLAQLLHVAMDFDLSNAVVLLRSADALPIVQRRQALDAAARSSGVTSTVEAVPTLIPRTRSLLQADYTLFLGRASGGSAAGTLASGVTGATTTAMLNARFASRFLAGAVTGSISTANTIRPFTDLRWTRIRPESRRLKRIVVGELDQRSAVSIRNHGISIDNYPVDLSEQRLIRVRGRAEPGWTYSLRQGSTWLGGARPDETLYEFLMPIVGDTRRVDIVGWGPNGEERRIARSVRALPVRVQRGDFQYALAAGGCEDGALAASAGVLTGTRCGVASSADGTFGVTDWFAARTGIDRVGGATLPYVGAALVLRQSLVLQATSGIGGRGRPSHSWSAQYEPSPTVAVGHTRNRTIDGRQTDFSTVRLTPVRYSGRFGVDGFLSTTSGMATPTRIGRVAASVGMRRSRFELFGVRSTSWPTAGPTAGIVTAIDAVGGVAQITPGWLRLPRTQRTSLLGSLDRTSRGDTRGAVQFIANTAQSSVELTRQFATRTQPGRWSILFSPRATRVRQSLSVSRTDAASGVASGTNTMMAMSGGAVWSPHSRDTRLSPEQATGRGSISGVAFLDLNEDGRRDPREPAIADVPVTVGNRSLRTDSAGRFHTGNLSASEQVEISVDSMSLPSPCWRAAASRWRVRAIDGGTADVALALRRGGVLEGRVLREQRRNGASQTVLTPWIDPPHLTATSTATGRQYQLDVFGSGSFYILGIPFGPYVITMQETDQRRNGIDLKPAPVTVAASAITGDENRDAYRSCPSTVAIIRTTPRAAGVFRPRDAGPRTSIADEAPWTDSMLPSFAATLTDETRRTAGADPRRTVQARRIAQEASASAQHDSIQHRGLDSLLTASLTDYNALEVDSTSQRTRVATRVRTSVDIRARRSRRAGLRRRDSARRRSRGMAGTVAGGWRGGLANPCDPFAPWRLQLRHRNYALQACLAGDWRKEPEFDGTPVRKPRRTF